MRAPGGTPSETPSRIVSAPKALVTENAASEPRTRGDLLVEGKTEAGID
jgi:hypothetical protein